MAQLCCQMGHVTHMNESCHTYEWVSRIEMSHVDVRFEFEVYGFVCLGHNQYRFLGFSQTAVKMAQLYCEMCHVTRMNQSCHTYEWVSRIYMSHVTHINESCHTYDSVMSHMNESCHTYEWVMSHIWMSHVTHMNQSYHIWMSHVTHMNESCHIWMSHVTHMHELCHTCEWVMCNAYTWVMSRIWMSYACHNICSQRHCVAMISRLLQMVGLFCRI